MRREKGGRQKVFKGKLGMSLLAFFPQLLFCEN